MNFNDFSKLEQSWITNAKKLNKTIVLPEAGFSKRTILAGIECAKYVCDVVFLVNDEKELEGYGVENIGNIKVVNINTHELTPIVENAYLLKRQAKGMTPEQAKIDIKNVYNYGAMMVDLGLVDGMVAGAEAPSKDVFGAAFRIVKAKQGDVSRIDVYGQEKEPATYRLAKMNLALRGISHHLGDMSDSSFTHDLHKGLYFNYIMANPPFNLKGWYDENLKNDARWWNDIYPERVIK